MDWIQYSSTWWSTQPIDSVIIMYSQFGHHRDFSDPHVYLVKDKVLAETQVEIGPGVGLQLLNDI